MSDREEYVDFYVGTNSLVSSIDKNRGGEHLVKVKAARLSSYVKLRKFDFAKIDVEGAEYSILRDLNSEGALKQVAQYLFEYHHNIKGGSQSMSEFLKVFEDEGFILNIKTTYEQIGGFQDVEIRALNPSIFNGDA